MSCPLLETKGFGVALSFLASSSFYLLPSKFHFLAPQQKIFYWTSILQALSFSTARDPFVKSNKSWQKAFQPLKSISTRITRFRFPSEMCTFVTSKKSSLLFAVFWTHKKPPLQSVCLQSFNVFEDSNRSSMASTIQTTIVSSMDKSKDPRPCCSKIFTYLPLFSVSKEIVKSSFSILFNNILPHLD